MVGTLLETHGVNLPSFLHPYPLVLVPVSEHHLEFAKEVAACLRKAGKECAVESSNEPLSAKVRLWKVRGAQKIVVVGDKERKEFSDAQLFSQSL